MKRKVEIALVAILFLGLIAPLIGAEKAQVVSCSVATSVEYTKHGKLAVINANKNKARYYKRSKSKSKACCLRKK